MADLSARLPTEIDSQKRYIDPAKPAPSALENIANFASGVVGVATRVGHGLEERADNKKKQAATDAQNDAARAFPEIFGPTVAQPADNDPGAAAAATSAGKAVPTLQNFQKASDQGTMDPGSAQARALAVTRQLYAKHPGYEAVVFRTLKEAGITDLVTQQYRNAEASLERDQNAQQDTLHKLDDYAVTTLGYSNYYTLSSEQRDVIRAQAALHMENEHLLDQQTKKVELLTKQVDLNDKQNKGLQTQVSAQTAQTLTNYMSSGFSNINKAMMNLVTDTSIAPDRLEKLQGDLISKAIPALDQMYASKVVPLLSTMSPEDRKMIEDTYTNQKKALTDMLTGPTSVLEQRKRILNQFETTYGIDYAKAAPTLMRVEKVLGSSAMGILLAPNMPPDLTKKLADELKGAVSTPGTTDDFSFGQFVKTLSGESDFNQVSPQAALKMAPGQINFMVNAAKDPTASNGTDELGHKALVNSIKNTAGIAVDVTPSWGFNNVLHQAKALGMAGVERALFFSSKNTPEREEAIRSWMPAVARTYGALARSDSGDNYYDIKLDPHTLQWSAVWNGKGMPEFKAVPGMEMPVVTANAGGKPAPTTAIREQVSSLNHMLHRMSDAAAHGYDTVLGKVSYTEARRFYAEGELPASLNKPKTGDGKTAKTPEQNVEDAVSQMLDLVNKLPNPGETTAASASAAVKGNLPKALNSAEEMDAYYAGKGKANAPLYKKYAPLVAQLAQKHGIPVGVAMNLIHTESKFNPNADSGKAFGLGQISYDEAKRRGWDVRNMSPEENLDKSLSILAENYKSTGNWQDAASMYFSGRPMAKAGNASDGNATVPTYVAAVVPSSYDWNPVYAAGYTRY